MNGSGLKLIITGVTGMVGEGVLHECLQDPQVHSVLIINRRPSGIVHTKLKEIIHADFFDLRPVASQLAGYDACFFCLGVSSVGMKEPEYYRRTHTLTLHFAEVLAEQHPAMVFCYVSGKSTDSTEKGKQMWARVKGKTENDLMNLPFKSVYLFRPGYLHPTPGLKNTNKYYRYISWLYLPVRAIFPQMACSLKELGLAMLVTAQKGYEKKIIEVTDIVALASQR